MYDLRRLLQSIMVIVPALMAVLLLFQLLRKQEPLKIKDRLKRAMNLLPFLLIVALVGGVISCAYQVTGRNLQGQFRIGYNYPAASKGLTPNETKLDAEEILSEEVLQKAIADGALEGLETGDLRQSLDVHNALQRSSVSADNYYLSTEYVVDYTATKATQKYDCGQLLKAVYEAYYDYFVEKYGRKTYVISDDFSELSQMDYLDVHTYFSRRATNIIDYMELCRKENPSFMSDKTQESFSSISKKASNFKDVSLERYHSYVLKYGLSKNKEQYISRLNYNNQMLNVRYMKNLAAYRIRLDAIDKYAGDITTAVLVPSRDDTGEFYQSRTKIGTDYFAQEADDYIDSATDRQLEIETNNYNIERLQAGTGGDAEKKKADSMLASLREDLVELSALAVETVQDYDEQTLNDYMNVVYYTGWYGLKYTAVQAVKYAAVWFLLAFMIIFAGDGMKRERIRRSKRKEP